MRSIKALTSAIIAARIERSIKFKILSIGPKQKFVKRVNPSLRLGLSSQLPPIRLMTKYPRTTPTTNTIAKDI